MTIVAACISVVSSTSRADATSCDEKRQWIKALEGDVRACDRQIREADQADEFCRGTGQRNCSEGKQRRALCATAHSELARGRRLVDEECARERREAEQARARAARADADGQRAAPGSYPTRSPNPGTSGAGAIAPAIGAAGDQLVAALDGHFKRQGAARRAEAERQRQEREAAAAAEEAREERRRAREAAVAAAIARDREELERRFAVWSRDGENAAHPFEDVRDDHGQLAEACARWGAMLAEMAPERFEDHCVTHLGVLAQRVEDLKRAWKEAESNPSPTPWRNVVTGGGLEIDVRFHFTLRPLRSGLPGFAPTAYQFQYRPTVPQGSPDRPIRVEHHVVWRCSALDLRPEDQGKECTSWQPPLPPFRVELVGAATVGPLVEVDPPPFSGPAWIPMPHPTNLRTTTMGRR